MKISILMAVYNAAQYLEKSIGSVLSQTNDEWELLCVDDCSTDESLAILKQYASENNKIKVWHQESNQGQAVARNIALDHAVGDVIMFLDADDWLSDDTVQTISDTFSKYEDAGCVLLKCRHVEPDGSEHDYVQKAFESMSGYDAFIKSLTWEIHGIYAVRADIHKAYPYDTTCRHYSDDNTTRLHYYVSKEVRECEAVYYYRNNSDSVSHKVSISQMDYLRANLSMRRQLTDILAKDKDHSQKEKTEVLSIYENSRWLNVLGLYIWFVRNRKSLSQDEKDYCLKELKDAWQSVDVSVLKPSNSLKPGYYPFRFRLCGKDMDCWKLFRIEAELLSFFRILLRR